MHSSRKQGITGSESLFALHIFNKLSMRAKISASRSRNKTFYDRFVSSIHVPLSYVDTRWKAPRSDSLDIILTLNMKLPLFFQPVLKTWKSPTAEIWHHNPIRMMNEFDLDQSTGRKTWMNTKLKKGKVRLAENTSHLISTAIIERSSSFADDESPGKSRGKWEIAKRRRKIERNFYARAFPRLVKN